MMVGLVAFLVVRDALGGPVDKKSELKTETVAAVLLAGLRSLFLHEKP